MKKREREELKVEQIQRCKLRNSNKVDIHDKERNKLTFFEVRQSIEVMSPKQGIFQKVRMT